MIKQVIVWRSDLKVRTGKKMAQASHSSMIWLAERVKKMMADSADVSYGVEPDLYFSKQELDWLVNGAFTKIVLQVENEEQLLDVYKKAKDAGLVVSLVTDAGKTEFNGVPTNTAICIGPDFSEKIDEITQYLKLY